LRGLGDLSHVTAFCEGLAIMFLCLLLDIELELAMARNAQRSTKKNEDGSFSKEWHNLFQDSHWVVIRNLPRRLSEGDVAVVFSQFGEVVDVRFVRDSSNKFTGAAFIEYEDVRSPVIATDNMVGVSLHGQPIYVGHAELKEVVELRAEHGSYGEWFEQRHAVSGIRSEKLT